MTQRHLLIEDFFHLSFFHQPETFFAVFPFCFGPSCDEETVFCCSFCKHVCVVGVVVVAVSVRVGVVVDVGGDAATHGARS